MKSFDNALFEDNHLLIVDKPAGMSTQGEFQVLAKEWLLENRGTRFLEPIHRLDRPVRGIVVFAKTKKALSRLNEQMRQGNIHKEYEAEIEGELKGEGELKHFIRHGHHRAHIGKHPEAKEARLRYKVIGSNPTRVAIELLTGRYHQIRAQFAHIGHPIIGDTKYGSKQKGEMKLTHKLIRLPHPISGELEIKSRLS